MFEELIGKQLGQYRIKEKIGEGGMATVFKAYQPNLDRMVAVKVLSEELAGKSYYISRFKREARVAAKLDHPNIVKVFDYGIQDGYYYLVMSHVEGSRTLSDLIREGVPVDELLGYILQIADALNYAHKQGTIHRDVKPSNILISGRWPLLADFGLVRSETSADDLTRTGMQMGTLAYMSPEQALGRRVDHHTDIYGLGAVLYKVLTGAPPRQAKKAHLVKALNQRRDISKRVKQVTLRALASEPEDRYESVADLKAELQKAIQRRAGPFPISPIAVGAALAITIAIGTLTIAVVTLTLVRKELNAPTPTLSPTEAAPLLAVGPTPSPTITQPVPKIVLITPSTTTESTGSELAAGATVSALTLAPPQATPTPIPLTKAPIATNTRLPTATPTLTATPTRPASTATPAPTASPTAAQALTASAGQFVLLKPAPPDMSTSGLTEFKWQWSGPLETDQGFEVRVWREGEPPAGVHDAVEDNQNGRVEFLDNNTYRLTVDITNTGGVQGRSGEYLWTVLLVQISPNYQDLGIQATPGRLRLEVPGAPEQDGGGGGGGGDGPSF